jgi:hypothetical protein
MVKHASDLAIGLQAIDAFDRLADSGLLDDTSLRHVIAAATCPASAVWGVGCDLLFVLAKTHPTARDAIRTILASKQMSPRWQIIASVHGRYRTELPYEFILEVLRTGLADKSAKVRRFAIDRGASAELLDLLPDLLALRSNEQDAKVLDSLAFYIPLLRDGYRLEPPSPGSHDPQFCVQFKHGITTRAVPLAVIDRLGLRRMAEIIREAKESGGRDVRWADYD